MMRTCDTNDGSHTPPASEKIQHCYLNMQYKNQRQGGGGGYVCDIGECRKPSIT